ncbi:peptide chain release factor 2 [candidate division WOR-1 bacterium RIFOXYB2_FULL_42_35]|uniref:Peptide chain release factor 2 n=1 Tax=candidate division WOR-1 bacterium RIFOXYC2_FULL_41_25 TaxID=1802586 RepID=A0A1F4TN61_UNCSA|nr:MAG: peptide chain release factor 2 [candidate division WOR-1 bacterium RIFOXYA2_FULL_41_14]OGC24504.1 MAG: peptide chain release factor 2 [candidate division WOR-1 bacterium RIFOXYB2_FULL_42_35]OGC34134.1 MAG: peptide chain release factor 2 [candidate division WOR-1 bacterium RIFOXYC2_FULL_41_25]OGC42822.1 MAG: peptide chain release factor 2 [candidate division WOR-1 bacterium RIFOXYD2_FULL_41_8]
MLDELKEAIKQLKLKSQALGSILKIEDKKKSLGLLEQETANPDIWKDQNRAKKIMQDKRYLEKELASYEEVRNGVDDLATLIEMAGESDLKDLKLETERLKKLCETLELAALLSGEYDKSNAILSIQAGAGGTDAQDWAQILLRMYSRWAENKEYKVEMVDISYGDEAGIKGVTLTVSGLYAYGYLKSEGGVHRLVRLSPFNSDDKRHTSFAAVQVIPEITEEISLDIDPSELRIDTYRASGPGGQHVNKTDSAVRITHLPTGLVSQSQEGRSQTINRECAMKVLKAKLYEMMKEQQKEKIDELAGERKKIEWGSQIRSYVFQPYTMVKDVRTGVEVSNVQSVVDGNIDPFIEGMLKGTKA